jgi:hypothetical protein
VVDDSGDAECFWDVFGVFAVQQVGVLFCGQTDKIANTRAVVATQHVAKVAEIDDEINARHLVLSPCRHKSESQTLPPFRLKTI